MKSCKTQNPNIPAVASLVLLLACAAGAYPFFRTQIPSGFFVPNPCRTTVVWAGVGHKDHEGGGDRNPFGTDFNSNGKIWNETLCKMDSDLDGRPNGVELGDPNCTWDPSMGNKTDVTDGITHPGICEPINAAPCLLLNLWLSCNSTTLRPDTTTGTATTATTTTTLK